MANSETFENAYFFGSPDGNETRLPAECIEVQTVEESSANHAELNPDECVQIDVDQNSGQLILTQNEAELLLGPIEYSSLSEKQNVSENVNTIPHTYENAQHSSQYGETIGLISDKLLRMRSILKKFVKTADSCENKTENYLNVEMPSHDVETKIVTSVSDSESAFDNSSVTLLVQKYSCDKCDKYFNNFVSLCDHQRKAHNAVSEIMNNNEDVNISESPCPESNLQINSTVIKVQNENLTRIVIDYDIADDKREQPKFSENQLLLQEQNEMAKSLKIEYCHICSRIFNNKKTRLKHLKTVHSIVSTSNNRIKCLDCNLDFKLRSNLRDHLQEVHNLNTKPEMLYFSTKDAFLTWKCNTERESLCSYFPSSKLKETNVLRYYCSRSGMKYSSEKHRKIEYHRMRGIGRSIKMGISCPSEIFAEVTPKGVLVTYHSTHYGHGGGIGIAQVFPAEKAAVDELVLKGYSFEKLMKELKGGEIMDNTQTFPLRKRYLKWVKQVFSAPSFHTSFFSDAECISQWVQKCCSMEESPILLCQLENIECEKEKFILVIMTEFQKQILLSNLKDLICVDVCSISKRSFIVMYVMDELHRAFPVAYCLCNSFSKYTVAQFFSSIKEHTGKLRPKYLISNMKLSIYEAWVDVMGDSPHWLWSYWSTRKLISNQLIRYAIKHEERCEIFDTMKIIMDCKSEDVFTCMFENLVKKLHSNIIFEKFRVWFEQRFPSNFDKWATYCRKDISCMTTLHLESMHYAIDIACSKATKQRSMFRLIQVLMKILRNKMMDRILDSFDDDKINLALDAINLYHESCVTIPEEHITFMCEKLWSIQNEDGEKEFVTQETETCPDHCVLKCKECNVCVHMFSCSCVNNMVNSNLCRHIHAVAFKFFKKNCSKPPSPSLCEPKNNKKEISLADFESLRKCMDTLTRSKNTSRKIASVKKSNSSHNLSSLKNSPQFETQVSQSDFADRESKQAALKKLSELHEIVKNTDLTDYTLNSLTKHLNLCHKIIKLNKDDPSKTKDSSSIPINAVYVVKPKNFTNGESVNKKCVKRFRFPSAEERNANLKKFKYSQPKLSKKIVMQTLLRDERLEVKKLTHTPLMIQLPNKSKTSESTFPTKIKLNGNNG